MPIADKGHQKMKIAITTSGTDLEAPLDRRFGRAPKFLILDLDSDIFQVVDNQQDLNSAQGAGIEAAQTIARLGVKAVVTGHCAPKALRILRAAAIKVLTTNAGTVAEALEQYRQAGLEQIDTQI